MVTPNYLTELKAQVCKYSRLSYQRYLVRAAGGNVSARLPGSRNFLITHSGVSLREVRKDDLIIVNGDGIPIGKRIKSKPSKETSLHSCVYKHRPEVSAVLHLHPPYATALSVGAEGLPMITAQARLKLVLVPVAGHADPGSIELAHKIDEVLANANPMVKAVLLMSHGLLAFGPDLASAFDIAELVEETAHIAFVLRLMGYTSPVAAGPGTLPVK